MTMLPVQGNHQQHQHADEVVVEKAVRAEKPAGRAGQPLRTIRSTYSRVFQRARFGRRTVRSLLTLWFD